MPNIIPDLLPQNEMVHSLSHGLYEKSIVEGSRFMFVYGQGFDMKIKNQKVVFYYNNGKTYTATKVVELNLQTGLDKVTYKTRETKPVEKECRFTIQKKSLAGIVVIHADNKVEAYPISKGFKFNVKGVGYGHK